MTFALRPTDPVPGDLPKTKQGIADFPYYAGDPVPIGSWGWLLLMGAVAAGFAALTNLSFARWPWSMAPALLFAGVPLMTLWLVAGRHWRALFRAVKLHGFLVMVGTAVASILVSAAAALIIAEFTTAIANPFSASLAYMSVADVLRHLVPTLPQLLGEELLTILPFLAILWFLTQGLGMTRRVGIIAALFGSTAIFAVSHLPTYQWNWLQCFGTIGAARVVLTLSYIWTRNLWVSTGAHVINDWTEFAFIFGATHLAIGVG